jgi:hypothetical protein
VPPLIEDRTEEMAHQLLLYRRELEPRRTSPSCLRLEAGRLASGWAIDRSRAHYEALMPTRALSALRALRRWPAPPASGQACSTLEAAGLRLQPGAPGWRHRADPDSPRQDLGRTAIGGFSTGAGDVRALLAPSAAYVDSRDDGCDSLDRRARSRTRAGRHHPPHPDRLHGRRADIALLALSRRRRYPAQLRGPPASAGGRARRREVAAALGRCWPPATNRSAIRATRRDSPGGARSPPSAPATVAPR